MNAAVIDTSVVMCALLDEPGRDRALEVAEGAFMSSVNVAETVTKCLQRGIPDRLALLYLYNSNISVVDFDFACAVLAGQLGAGARRGILSLGDRACIATAMRRGGTAFTADSNWSTLDLPCPIELIR